MTAPDDYPPGLPATVAEVFLALVGVVMLMLFALAPSVRASAPEGPAAASSREQPRQRLLIDGQEPELLIAEAGGLRVEGAGGGLIALDRIAGDEALGARLRQATSESRPLLLVIEPDGQEAAFLFPAAASAAGVTQVRQLRVTAACPRSADSPIPPGRCLAYWRQE